MAGLKLEKFLYISGCNEKSVLKKKKIQLCPPPFNNG